MSGLPVLVATALTAAGILSAPLSLPAEGVEGVPLPAPSHQGKMTVEEALKARRTHRSFRARALTLRQLAQLLWAADGVSGKQSGRSLRTAPSAGALYPVEVYAAAGKGGVEGLEAGVYRYLPEGHRLERVREGDRRAALARAALGQTWTARAPVALVVAGEYARSAAKYGERGVIYTRIEAGHVGQNVFLQAEALGLKAGIVGAFRNEEVARALGIPADRDPLLIMPVGYPD